MSLISVTDYSKLTGKDTGTIRKLLANGRIHGVKIGNQWAIDDKEPFPADKRVNTGEYKNWRKYYRFGSNTKLKNAIKSLVNYSKKSFGDSLDSIILYGSYARGEQTDESDIDIALKLKSGYDKNTLNYVIEYVSEKELECDKILSVIDIDEEKYNEWKTTLPFYMNIEKEGIVLWQA